MISIRPPAASIRCRWAASPTCPSRRLSVSRPGGNPTAVVLDDQGELVGLVDEAEVELGGVSVLNDVGQKLARRREDELFLCMPARTPKVEPYLQVRSTCCPLRVRAERSFEPGFVEHVRMKIEDGIAQLAYCLHEGLVGGCEGGIGSLLAVDLFEDVADGEEVLEGVIVKCVRERLAFTLLRVERVAEQARSHLGELLDKSRPPGEQQRQENACDADPREEPRLRHDEPNCLWLVYGGMCDGLDDVGSRRHNDGDTRERRAKAKRHRHRDDEERKPSIGEGAARQDREHADRCDIDACRHEREPLTGRAEVHPGQHGGAPRREERQRDEETRLLRVWMRETLAERDEHDRG